MFLQRSLEIQISLLMSANDKAEFVNRNKNIFIFDIVK